MEIKLHYEKARIKGNFEISFKNGNVAFATSIFKMSNESVVRCQCDKLKLDGVFKAGYPLLGEYRFAESEIERIDILP